MELQRKRAAAAQFLFPLVDTSGAVVTAASALDTEVAFWDDVTATTGFLDATNESTESSAFGWYKFLATSDEMAHDYIAIKIDGDNANIVAQNLLVATVMHTSDAFLQASQVASAVWGFSTRGVTSNSTGLTASDVWVSSSRSLSASFIPNITSAVWGFSTRGLTSLDDISCAVWAFSSRDLTSEVESSDVWASSSRTLSTGFLPADMASAVWGFATRSITSFSCQELASLIWTHGSRTLTSEELASDVWAHTLSSLSTVTGPSAEPDAASALQFLFQGVRNARITNDSFDFITDDAGALVLRASLSDAGSTFNKGEWTTI